jgi:hypothetical protein
MTNSLNISAAPGEPFILVTGKGLWTADQFDRHFRALDRELRAMRARAGHARVLVDLSGALVQTAEATAVMNHWTARIYSPRDEVAVVCATTLQAMQIKREARDYRRMIFPDKKAALAWLLSDKQAGAAPRKGRTA